MFLYEVKEGHCRNLSYNGYPKMYINLDAITSIVEVSTDKNWWRIYCGSDEEVVSKEDAMQIVSLLKNRKMEIE